MLRGNIDFDRAEEVAVREVRQLAREEPVTPSLGVLGEPDVSGLVIQPIRRVSVFKDDHLPGAVVSEIFVERPGDVIRHFIISARCVAERGIVALPFAQLSQIADRILELGRQLRVSDRRR
ncbi:hypothetical protein [Nocardia sp. NPDC057272]|uniref:hypothetical protein n=1 Tax=Nocardia sp. NPDC057272 TaxID=3346079 RepID=UPI0036361045